MKEVLDMFKSVLVCLCLVATLCATCRQEQASDKINAEITALQNVSATMRECVYVAAPESEDRQP